MDKSGEYEIKSPILMWWCERYMYADHDTLNIWVLHGLFLLCWFALPIGLIQEIYLQRRDKAGKFAKRGKQ